MDTEKSRKTERLVLRINSSIKDKIHDISTKKGQTITQIITSLIEQYISNNDVNNNNIVVNVPMDKVSYARIKLYALEHNVEVDQLLLSSVNKMINSNNHNG